MKDSVHYLEPHGRKSKDMQIFGDGLMTLLHRWISNKIFLPPYFFKPISKIIKIDVRRICPTF